MLSLNNKTVVQMARDLRTAIDHRFSEQTILDIQERITFLQALEDHCKQRGWHLENHNNGTSNDVDSIPNIDRPFPTNWYRKDKTSVY